MEARPVTGLPELPDDVGHRPLESTSAGRARAAAPPGNRGERREVAPQTLGSDRPRESLRLRRPGVALTTRATGSRSERNEERERKNEASHVFS